MLKLVFLLVYQLSRDQPLHRISESYDFPLSSYDDVEFNRLSHVLISVPIGRQKQPYIWNCRPWFDYSLYDFYDDYPMGRLYPSISL